MVITRKELIKNYIEFFKLNEHKEIPNSSLVPANDPTVLFTTAGMHPLVPFLLGQKHPLGKKLVNVQRCIRTGDIDEVGNTTHHTFFEMLGNWSLGDYFKKQAIEMSFEFITKVLKIPLERFAVTVFMGDEDAPKDDEAAKIWLDLGVSKDRIAFLPKKDNWWGPAGETGPCGPDTEMFYWRDSKEKAPKKFNPEDKRWVEIWNDVLMQYNRDRSGKYIEAKQKNIDTGMGVERVLAVTNGFDDNYLTEVWQPIIKEIEILSEKKYGKDPEETKAMRIIADHLKASVFIIGDGVVPGNAERGYVLRRLIRRAVRYGRLLGLREFTRKVCLKVFDIYDDYDNLVGNKQSILDEIEKEETKFNLTLEQGMKVFDKLVSEERSIDGKNAFLLYQSYGFPIEMTIELAKEAGIFVDEKRFEEESKKHQELSRTASAGTFKSGLADNSEGTTKLHTAAHLLNEALRQVLDKDIKQKGSNINPERLRFDFNFARKVESAELKKVEEWVNDKINKKLEVKREEMKVEEALKSGAHGEFGAKYPDIVSVYTIMDGKKIISKEICTGPHVKNTSELGSFKIVKEESSSAGIRRIKAVVE
ncbi:Alanine--tRNA ligase [uncultured archaeon]|nr:Alanine--tRNA ligase [uncultured archaeon]